MAEVSYPPVIYLAVDVLGAAVRDVLDPWMNPVTWAVPFFLLFIGIELAALKWLDHDDVTGYLFMPPDWQPASVRSVSA